MKPFIVCITGGIGSGKSVVSRVLRLNGYNVYDCDSEAKVLMESDPMVREGLVKILGMDAFGDNGKLNRKFIASIIFTDFIKRNEVNKLVHKAVRRHFKSFVNSCENSLSDDSEAFKIGLDGNSYACHKEVVFCETAIPVSSRLEDDCDEIWLVEASEDLRMDRVIKRNGLPEREIKDRMKTQAEEFDAIQPGKRKIIDNDGMRLLLPQIYNKLELLKIKEEICLEIF